MTFVHEENRIAVFAADGTILAQVSFPAKGDGVVKIDHTFVAESLRGQGVAGRLMEELTAQLRENGQKAVPVCSYAVRWFETHPEHRELLADTERENTL